MKLICTVKFVPDPDSTVADTARLILNPDDACALAFALQVKACNPVCMIEAVTMAPCSVRPHMADLMRLGVDRGTLISDPLLRGSDSFVTGEVLARYIAGRPFDCLLTGSHSLDGGSAQVPAYLAEALGLDQMLGVLRIYPDLFNRSQAVFQAADENGTTTYEMAMPGVLSLARESGYKLPYVKLSDMRRDITDGLSIVTCRDLGFSASEVGHAGTLTHVVESRPVTYGEKRRLTVGNDDAGIASVLDFLKRKGVL